MNAKDRAKKKSLMVPKVPAPDQKRATNQDLWK